MKWLGRLWIVLGALGASLLVAWSVYMSWLIKNRPTEPNQRLEYTQRLEQHGSAVYVEKLELNTLNGLFVLGFSLVTVSAVSKVVAARRT